MLEKPLAPPECVDCSLTRRFGCGVGNGFIPVTGEDGYGDAEAVGNVAVLTELRLRRSTGTDRGLSLYPFASCRWDTDPNDISGAGGK